MLLSQNSITGIVFNDVNGDGVKQASESGLASRTLEIQNAMTGTVQTATTDASGNYRFNNVADGIYIVSQTPVNGWKQTSGQNGYTILALGGFTTIKSFGNSQLNATPSGSISGGIYQDNGNNPATGLAGWTVQLLGMSGSVVSTTASTANGSYLFSNVPAGQYRVQESLQSNWQLTSSQSSYTINVTNGSALTNKDFANAKVSSINGKVIQDTNGDGILQSNEPGLQSVVVQLLTASGSYIRQTSTNATGAYSFAGLTPGTYQVRQVLQSSWIQTSGSSTYTVALGSGSNSMNNNFGDFKLATITGTVFEDTSSNGTLDTGEHGMQGWTVQLIDSTGRVAAQSVTNGSGKYNFSNVLAGSYSLNELSAVAGTGVTATTSVTNIIVTSGSATTRDVGVSINTSPLSAPHEFYIDSVNGNSSGDGSAARPWASLQDVIDAKLISGNDPSKGKIHAGDTIYLMSGNYGSIRLSGDNTDYITIEAAAGQHPVLNGVLMYGGSKWAFKGLTFQNAAEVPKYNYLARFDSVDDLIFTGNTLYSKPDATDWTADDWDSSGSSGLSYSGNNATISNNLVKNVIRGILISGDQIELSNNTIDYYVDDGIDFTSGNTIIRNNTVTNHYGKVQDGNHNDGIQGWALDGIPRSNLTIDGNIVIESTGTYSTIPAIPTGLGQDYIQGISIFDGDWSNVTVTNNLVAVSAYHGLSFYSLSNSQIVNNTVLKLSSNSDMNPWLGVFPGKDGKQPTNVIVRNNIANFFNLPLGPGTSDDHNISINPNSVWKQGAGDLLGVDVGRLFINSDPTKGPLNLQLALGSPAIGAGNLLNAPLIDIKGILRNGNHIDIGAYAK